MMDDNDKAMYSDVIKESPNMPFSNFVSKGNIRDRIDIARPRSIIDTEVQRLVNQTYRDQSTRLIPILGSVGAGKTHTYHAFKLKEIENRKKLISDDDLYLYDINSLDWSIIYIPSPPASIKVPMHIYTCIIEELGVDILNEVSSRLIYKWVKKSKPKLKEIEKIIQEGMFSYTGAYVECVKCLSIFALDKNRKDLAKRWLIAETLSEVELYKLGVNSLVEGDDICLAMIKIIMENSDRVLLLYFDELESPYRIHGRNAVSKLLAIIKRFYNEFKMLIIILAVLKGLWPIILEIADDDLISCMEPEQELKAFSLNDLKIFFHKTMEVFWEDNNLNPPKDPLFPLNEKIIEFIYSKSKGNPRVSIKLCRQFVEKIILGELELNNLKKIDEEIISSEIGTYRASTLFLSYSWESKKHKKWVLNLAEQLCEDGIDVKLDIWEVKTHTNIPLWMENAIEKADFILLICTNEYGRKANTREKGVGYEYTIINTDLFYTLDEKDRKKTICLLRSGNQREAIPRYLRTRYFLDFRDESSYSIEYENLLREIFEKPKYVKPKIGTPPKL